MRGSRAAGAGVVLAVFALGVWLLFIRTPDGAGTPAATSSERDHALTPTFPSITTTSAPGAGSSVASATPSTGGETPSSIASATGPDQPLAAALDDPVGDLTFSVDPPPPWADLAGATLTRSSSGFELRVRLGGGTAPNTIDAGHTMNIASFFDLDGNGTIDYEVWANLADTGWGGSYFDDTSGFAAYLDQSYVSVAVDGDSVIIRFPLAHLRSATAFRWSVASEWGRREVVGTNLAARDDAPDNDAPAAFPG